MSVKTTTTDALIIGASAAGLMCAIEAGKRGRKVIALDHANKAGKKILMSGGGRCNFTNIDVDASHFISHNPHFCKSALTRFTQWDFISMVERHAIPYHERDLGKLFCDDSAKDILSMLLHECRQANVDIRLNCNIVDVEKTGSDGFIVNTPTETYHATSLVVASGGLSIPKMCATPLGYQLAEQFGHSIQPTSPGLVPFTLHPQDRAQLEKLSGISVDSRVSNQRMQFEESILFTHRGLSGPAILQISSYWKAGEAISIDLLPKDDVCALIRERKLDGAPIKLKTLLNEHLPKRLIAVLFEQSLLDTRLQELSKTNIRHVVDQLQHWSIKPNATEGYRTAEVTLGGVNCDELSSRTMQSMRVEGLYFIGEVVDVTGWLGGYNFQWAWSSGWCAGQFV